MKKRLNLTRAVISYSNQTWIATVCPYDVIGNVARTWNSGWCLSSSSAGRCSSGNFSVPVRKTALQKATHPVTSDRARGMTEELRRGHYGEDQAIALEIAVKLQRIADEMDDRDWQLYFKSIGQRAPLSQLRPRWE